MTPNNLNTIFTSTCCIAEETLLRYANGELAFSEKHAVEKHLVDCEICSDAVEGLSLLKNRSQAKSLAENLNRFAEEKISTSTGSKVIRMDTPSSSWDVRLKIAAAVTLLVLAGGGYYFINKSTDDLHKNIVAEQAPAPAVTPEEPKTEVPAAAESNAGTYTVSVMDSQGTIGESNNQIPADEKKYVTSKLETQTASGSRPPAPSLSSESKKEYNPSGVIAFSNSPNLIRADSVRTYIWSFGDSSTLAMNSPRKAEPLFTPAAAQPSKAKDIENFYEGAAKAKPHADDKLSETEKKAVEVKAPTVDSKQKAEEDAGKLQLEQDTQVEKAAAGEKRKESAVKKSPQSKNNRSVVAAYGSKSHSRAKTSTSASSEKTKPTDNFSEAMKKYFAKEYLGALKLFEEVLKEKPDHYEALYYSGECYQRTGQPDKAIKMLDKILNDFKENGTLYDDALWFKALAHLDKKETAAAKKLLEEVVNANGKYKLQAEEKLKKIK